MKDKKVIIFKKDSNLKTSKIKPREVFFAKMTTYIFFYNDFKLHNNRKNLTKKLKVKSMM